MTFQLQKHKFAMVGVGGFVAQRHLKALANLKQDLIAACDPHDNVGILDRFFPNCAFFTEIERFERHIEKRKKTDDRVDFVSICTPNYLHDSHCRLALRAGANAICEKPLVINPKNLDQLAELELETGKKIFNILQLRLHPSVQTLKQTIEDRKAQGSTEKIEFDLTYITRRGAWYLQSWKGDTTKSGSLAMNIGVHFFDMLLWLFGSAQSSKVYLKTDTSIGGFLELENANVRWFLSIDLKDLPQESIQKGHHAYRSLKMNGIEFDFSDGFDDLHQAVYENILLGKGFGIEDARPAIELVHHITHIPISQTDENTHTKILEKRI